MELNFSTDSYLLFFAAIFAITILPVKIGATVFGAENNEFKNCVIAVFLGTTLALLCGKLIGGFIGLVVAFIAVSTVYSKILGLSFSWSFLFTIGVIFIQIGIMQALTKFGMFT